MGTRTGSFLAQNGSWWGDCARHKAWSVCSQLVLDNILYVSLKRSQKMWNSCFVNPFRIWYALCVISYTSLLLFWGFSFGYWNLFWGGIKNFVEQKTLERCNDPVVLFCFFFCYKNPLLRGWCFCKSDTFWQSLSNITRIHTAVMH